MAATCRQSSIGRRSPGYPPRSSAAGHADDWYTPQMLETDAARLREAGVAVTVVTLDAGHEWTAAFSEAAADFLSRVRR